MSVPAPRSWFRGIGGDLRYVLRVLAKSPAFCTVTVLSLAIGIGANTAIFSVVRALLLEPLPVDRPTELKWVYWSAPKSRNAHISRVNSSGWGDPSTKRSFNSNYTYEGYQALNEAAGKDAALFGFNFIRDLNVIVEGRPAVVASGMLVAGDYFSSLRRPTPPP